MNRKGRTGILIAFTLGMAALTGFAQPPAISSSQASNLWYNEFIFLPGGLRGMAKMISATNETFRLALRYIGDTRRGQAPLRLPHGLTRSDISNAEYKITIWPFIVPPKPINFYGMAVDESGRPLMGAVAHFEWDAIVTNKNVMEFKDWPKVSADIKTDKNGGFSFTNKSGTELNVSVSKAGYYSSRTNRGAQYFKFSQPNLDAFYGWSNDSFKANSNQPVLYYLRKMGVGADTLVTSQRGVRDDFWVSAPKDGTPVKVDLLHQKTGVGPLEIIQKKPEFPAHGGTIQSLSPSDRAKLMSATNWSITMRIGNGGFIEEDQEFPFNPPEAGYQDTLNYHFQKGQKEWQGTYSMELQKDYYIKFGSPPVYGHLHLQTSADSGYVILGYSINPDGSRNLEPKH